MFDLGSRMAFVRDDPKRFALFLLLLFVFFFFVLARAVVDFVEIVRKHFTEREELFRTTLGEEEFVKEYKMKDPRELALKAMAEIRGQLKLQLEIFQALFDLNAAQEFQNEVLEAIGEASSETRDAIINRLNQRRAIRSVVRFN